jgi:EH domain-containing protein 1
LQELTTLPGKSCDRKVSEVVKRVRALKVHLLVLQHLKKQMPAVLGKTKAQNKILDNLPDHFHTVRFRWFCYISDSESRWHRRCVVMLVACAMAPIMVIVLQYCTAMI